MLAVLRDLGLEKYIATDAKIPESANKSKPTAEELDAQRNGAKVTQRHAPE